MTRKTAMKIQLSEKLKKILTELNLGTHTPSHIRLRTGIILMANAGRTNNAIEKEMGINGETVTKWRNRYSAAQEELGKTEAEEPRKLRQSVNLVLSDARRPGKPSKFTNEQVACIIAMSCQHPSEYNLPYSHWTPGLLREEAIKREIVDSISTSQVSRFLKRKRFKAASS